MGSIISIGLRVGASLVRLFSGAARAAAEETTMGIAELAGRGAARGAATAAEDVAAAGARAGAEGAAARAGAEAAQAFTEAGEPLVVADIAEAGAVIEGTEGAVSGVGEAAVADTVVVDTTVADAAAVDATAADTAAADAAARVDAATADAAAADAAADNGGIQVTTSRTMTQTEIAEMDRRVVWGTRNAEVTAINWDQTIASVRGTRLKFSSRAFADLQRWFTPDEIRSYEYRFSAWLRGASPQEINNHPGPWIPTQPRDFWWWERTGYVKIRMDFEPGYIFPRKRDVPVRVVIGDFGLPSGWRKPELRAVPRLVFRAKQKLDQKDFEGQKIRLAGWNVTQGTATACWEKNGAACGELKDFFPPCAAIDTNTLQVIDSAGHRLNYNYFVPNGSISIGRISNPSDKIEANWILLTNEQMDYDCRNIWQHTPGKEIPASDFKSLDDSQKDIINKYLSEHGGPIQEDNTAPWDPKTHTFHWKAKRDDVLNYFTNMPMDEAGQKEFAKNGAALLHRSLVNESSADAALLTAAMTRILETHDEQHKMVSRRWFPRATPSGEIMTRTMLDAMLDAADEQYHDRLRTHGIRAVTQSIVDRADNGKSGEVDGYALYHVFASVFDS